MKAVNLNIPESQLKDLLTYFEDKRRNIVRIYKEDIEDIDSTIKQIKDTLLPKPETIKVEVGWAEVSGDFNPDWTWKQKIEYVLNAAGQPLTATKILARLINIDPVTRQKPTVANRSISGTLSVKSSQGDTFIADKSGKENLYSLQEWYKRVDIPEDKLKTSDAEVESNVF